ncbi:hypothetical protein A8F94_21310 [Bacillus sp. FJAT-27225]|uniref:sigma-70 family RNA polymerase sigma factor n=1 Tax=Bacillus sp. FJAT-27225 TaxID=1743144 RepID=UPI00080C2FFD|nr:sigma-70 family RNA polymerase sigma factor [Bacillus sp. FJAT-27225]OCA82443.1 hypothetical protein A8F94_21310 [Bacillus sp. FJAT-27225]
MERYLENFEHIAAQYEPMLNSIIRSLHIQKNEDEFYQIGLIALWEAVRGFDPSKGKFESYAYGFIKGRMMIEITRSSRRFERTIYLKSELWDTIEDRKASETELTELLDACTDILTANQKKWLVYTCRDDLTVREIAALENVSISTVKSWRSRAQQKLKGSIFK